MAWFGDGLPRLSDLKGQLTNFTKEVLSEGIVDEIGDDRSKALNDANEKISQLQEDLNSKDAEISFLRRQNRELEKTVVELNSRPNDSNDISQDESGDAFFWDPPATNSAGSNKQKRKVRLLQNQLAQATLTIQDLESELKRAREDANTAWRNDSAEDEENAEYMWAKNGLLSRINEVDEEEYQETTEASLIADFRAIVSKLSSSEKQGLVKKALRAIERETDGKNNLEHDEITYENQNGPSTDRDAEMQEKIVELQEENTRLVSSMEQLDQDHNEAIDKVLSLKEMIEADHITLKNSYSELRASYSEAMEKVAQLEKEQLVEKEETPKRLETVSQIVQTSTPETNETDVQTDFVEASKEEPKDTFDINELSDRVRKGLKRTIPVLNGGLFFDALIEDYNELLETKVDLENRIGEVLDDLKKAQDGGDRLREKCAEMQTHMDSLAFEIGQVRDENLKLQSNAEFNLEKQAHSALAEIDALSKRIVALEESESARAQELQFSKDRCKHLESEKQALGKSLRVLQEQKDDVEIALTRSREASIAAWNEMQKSMEAEKSQARETTNNLLSHARNLESELSRQVQTVTQEKHDLLEEAVAREDTLDEIKLELSEAKEKYDMLKTEISTMFTKILGPENETLLIDTTGKNEFQVVKLVIERFDTFQNEFARIKNEIEGLRLKENELLMLQENFVKITEQNSHLQAMIQQLQHKTQNLEELIARLENEKTKLASESSNDTVNIEKHNLLASLEERTRETETLKNDNALLMKEISEMQNKLQKAFESNSESTDMAKQTIESLSHLVKEKDEEMNSLRSDLDAITVRSSNESESFATMRNERDELVKLVTHKHNESLQYHAEIQRLTQVLSEQTARIKELMSEQKENASTDEQKDAELYWTRNELQVVQQRLKNLEGGEEKCLIIEHSTQLAEIALLTEKCNALEAALIQEQSNTRLLQNQLTESQNKEANAARELERLRNHLVEMESSYTEEALIAEDMRKELEGKLSLAEDKIKNSSTAYTSANIRANQQVETLQQQMALIIQQRDDIQKKLCAAEDKVLSQTASLTNLQIVLEQFQTDKERDVSSATHRIQEKLKESHRKQEDLMNEIANLKEQLAEAKECLQAASRLSEQLDKKSERIEQLSQEVERLSQVANTSDQQMQQVKQDEQTKVDKALIKNLLLGYLASSTTDKPSVLRVFATILDFNDIERDKTGLNHSSSSNGWFARLSGGSLSSTKDQEASLSAAFVRFLESESKPKAQLPALPIQTTPLSKPGHSRQPSTSSTQSALLLSNVELPTFSDFIPARNTGSILKEVLKDS